MRYGCHADGSEGFVQTRHAVHVRKMKSVREEVPCEVCCNSFEDSNGIPLNQSTTFHPSRIATGLQKFLVSET